MHPGCRIPGSLSDGYTDSTLSSAWYSTVKNNDSALLRAVTPPYLLVQNDACVARHFARKLTVSNYNQYNIPRHSSRAPTVALTVATADFTKGEIARQYTAAVSAQLCPVFISGLRPVWRRATFVVNPDRLRLRGSQIYRSQNNVYH